MDPTQPPTALDIHRPQPITIHQTAACALPSQPGSPPTVQSIMLPDGRIVTGYAINHVQPEPVTAKPPVSRTAVNIALGGAGFLAVCGGLLLLTSFIAALTALVTQLVVLAAVIFGGWIAVQVFGHRDDSGGATITIHKAIFKRNNFRG
jgi:hypothetical protein